MSWDEPRVPLVAELRGETRDWADADDVTLCVLAGRLEAWRHQVLAKASLDLLAALDEGDGWSRPVRVKVGERQQDGTYELIFEAVT